MVEEIVDEHATETRAPFLPVDAPCPRCGETAARQVVDTGSEQYDACECACGMHWNEPIKET